MPLQLPTLDNRGYADLVAEARRLIAVHDPAWTNHNPSDPGITLIELFAYLTEMLVYRLDRVTADNQRKFLRLLNGPGWTPGPDLADDIRNTVLAVRARDRAVTAGDFERLAIEGFNPWLDSMQRAEAAGAALDDWWRITQLDPAASAHRPSAMQRVARAKCVVSRNLDRGSEAERMQSAPAHVSLIVLPQATGQLQPTPAQNKALWAYLDERRTLTTRHHVVGPRYAPVGAEIVLATTTGAKVEFVRLRLVRQLEAWLDPRSGGPTRQGWPFGRDVHVSELYEQLKAVDGVDYVVDLQLQSACLATDTRCAAAQPLWHAEGDAIGLSLAAYQLPLARFDNPARLVMAPSTAFVAAAIAVTLACSGSAEVAMIKQQAKAVIRRFCHPLHGGPGPGSGAGTALALPALQAALAQLNGVVAVKALALQADRARLVMQDDTAVGLRLLAGELISWQTHVSVVPA